MYRFIKIVLGVLLTGSFCGKCAEVQWTARGSVTLVRGEDFLQIATTGAPVSIELSYDNASEGEIFRQIFDFSDQLFWQQEEYYNQINLNLSITIGNNTWQGILGSGSSGSPYSLEIQDVKLAGDTADFFRVTVAKEDGGSFPVFPGGDIPGVNPSMRVEFRDESTGGGEAPDYLDSTDLACVSQSVTRITEALGFVSNGLGQVIRFTVDPTTIRARLSALEEIELRKVVYDPEFDEVLLTWASIPGKFYIIQYLAEDLCWREKSSTLAVSSETTWSVLPLRETELYRVIEEE
mgnify:CR=1 FL=1